MIIILAKIMQPNNPLLSKQIIWQSNMYHGLSLAVFKTEQKWMVDWLIVYVSPENPLKSFVWKYHNIAGSSF